LDPSPSGENPSGMKNTGVMLMLVLTGWTMLFTEYVMTAVPGVVDDVNMTL
jgi:hypothetical protein